LGGLATRDHHAVIEDVRAGAVLGGTDKLADIGQVRRTASRDDARRESERTQSCHRFVVEALRGIPAAFSRIKEQPAKLETCRVAHNACELDGLFRSFYARTLAARIAFDHHADRRLGTFSSLGIGRQRYW